MPYCPYHCVLLQRVKSDIVVQQVDENPLTTRKVLVEVYHCVVPKCGFKVRAVYEMLC